MIKPLITIILVFLGVIAVGIFLFTPPGINSVHQNIVGSPIPQDAKNVLMERSSIFNSWKDNYCIISYNLEPSALIKTLDTTPAGFLDWKPLGEIGVGHHLFTSAEMHHTRISTKTNGRLYYAVLVDLDHHKVYVMSVFN